jgi:hypothetical protein
MNDGEIEFLEFLNNLKGEKAWEYVRGETELEFRANCGLNARLMMIIKG